LRRPLAPSQRRPWFGKLVSVDVGHRQLAFIPACKFKSGRFHASASRARIVLSLGAHPELEIYFRPGGNAEAGHGQAADLRELADVVIHGRLPDFPPGWFLTVRRGRVVAVEENSGLTSSDPGDKRIFACVWNART